MKVAYSLSNNQGMDDIQVVIDLAVRERRQVLAKDESHALFAAPAVRYVCLSRLGRDSGDGHSVDVICYGEDGHDATHVLNGLLLGGNQVLEVAVFVTKVAQLDLQDRGEHESRNASDSEDARGGRPTDSEPVEETGCGTRIARSLA